MEKLENSNLNVKVMTFVDENGDIVFKAKDVASALGYERPKDAISSHVSSKYKVRFSEIKGGRDSQPPCGEHPETISVRIQGGGDSPAPCREQPGTIFIKEPGVYALIFRSKLPVAERFQDRVFSDVLPSIRKTGTYTVSDPISRVRSVTHYELMEYTADERKEYKTILRTQIDMLKDPEAVERGRRGGLATQENRRRITKERNIAYEIAFHLLSLIGIEFD